MVSCVNISLVKRVILSASFDGKLTRFLDQTSLLTGSLLTVTLMMMFILSTRFGRVNFPAMGLNVKLV